MWLSYFLLLTILTTMAFTQYLNNYTNYYNRVIGLLVSLKEKFNPASRYLEEVLLKSVKLILMGMNLKTPYYDKNDGKGKAFTSYSVCLACRASAEALIQAVKFGTISQSILKRMFSKICVLLKVQSKTVCNGLVALNSGTIIHIIKKKRLSATKICFILLQGQSCSPPRYEREWTVKIPNRTNNNHHSNVKPQEIKSKPIKILQITDLHYDPRYRASSNAVCGEPLCCQVNSVHARGRPQDASGFWGDYRKCDTPWHSFTDAIDHIIAQHKDIAVVYFTGDIINHLVWATSEKSNIEVIQKVHDYLNKKFKNVPIYSVLGNHESHPANLFAPVEITQKGLSTNWLYKLAVDQWNLPKETRETILRGGYYTTLVKPGFRIVGLNSNVCYILNWWILYNDVDPYGQLKWLVQVLLQAEKNNEVVHIISHFPTNDEHCLKNWSKQYIEIIKRFSNIIKGQFNGHTHVDDFIVYLNEVAPFKPYSTAFNGGSLTTYENVNPNYKIYYADPSNLDIVEAESWTYNITSANFNAKVNPKWYKLYSFSEEFGKSPSSVGQLLVEHLLSNATTFQKFFRFKHRDAAPMINKGCNKHCWIKTICDTVTPYLGYKKICNSLNRRSAVARNN